MSRRSDATATGIVVAVWLVSTLLWISPGITLPDGAGYFVYLPSVRFDGDLLFFDEWRDFGMIRNGIIEHKEITATEHLGNHWTVGSAIGWMPAFAVGEFLHSVVPRFERFTRNGITLPYNASVATGSAIAGLAALLLSYRSARRLFANRPSLLAIVAIWFGSTLMWYSLKNPIMSHAMSAAACAAVVLLSLAAREDRAGGEDGASESLLADPWLAAGLACGFAIAVRPQNATFALVPLIVAGLPRARRLAVFCAGLLLGVLPEVVASSFIYGSPFGFLTGGGAAKPFAAFERIWIWQPVFSWYHGLVPWTPLLGVGAIGFIALYRKDRRLGSAALWAFGTQWLINAVMERSFWGAYAFGQRRFDNCTVFFALGLAALFARIGLLPSILISAVACAWTMSLFFASFDAVDLNVYYTPSELFELQSQALSRIPDHLGFLDAVPPGMGGAVLWCITLTVAAYALLILLPRRWRVPCAASILIVASVVLGASGVRGLSRVDENRELIARNRFFAAISGGPDARIGLLGAEADYLAKIGRLREAAEVRGEAILLLARRERAMSLMEAGQ